MKLTEEDANLYFKLTWSWQFFVTQKLQLFPDVTTVEDYRELSADEKIIVRDACYEHPQLLDKYLKSNPDDFSPEELAIMRQWKNPVQGEFRIERYLKNHAIFITENEKVYAVVGLYMGFDEMIPKNRLPLPCQTSLLPFKGKIIYDGLMKSYSVYFGGGIKSSLKKTYIRAKQNGRIIDSFEETSKITKKELSYKSYNKEINALKKISQPLRGGTNQPPLNSPAFSVLKAAIELTEQSLEKQTDKDEIYKAIRKLDKASNKLLKIIELME